VSSWDAGSGLRREGGASAIGVSTSDFMPEASEEAAFGVET